MAKIGHTIAIRRPARFKKPVATCLEGRLVLAELAYLVSHELKVRRIRTNPFVNAKLPVPSKSGSLSHVTPIGKNAVQCVIEYELPHIGPQEIVQTIQQFTTNYLLDAARDIAEFIENRGRGKLVSMAPMDLPGGCEWAEEIRDMDTGLALRLVRGYLVTCNLMFTVVSARYLVTN